MTTTTIATAPITPDELLKLPDSVRYELVNGQLVERHMGTESSAIALQVAILLGMFLRQHRLGLLLGSDAGYQCFSMCRRRYGAQMWDSCGSIDCLGVVECRRDIAACA